MAKKLYSFLPALVFLVFLFGMAIALFAGPVRDYSENEKRYLAGRPEVTAQKLLDGKTQEELESFTSDQVHGRDLFVGIDAYWTLATGRNAAEDIYHAKDGYLINAPKPFDEATFTANLTRFDEFTRTLGVPGDLVMVPSTGYLMADVLPAGHGTYDDDLLYERAAGLLQDTRLIDVRQTLKDGVQQGQVCYRTDHHLTSFGNYLLYRAYQAAQGLSVPDESAYAVTSYDGFYGTTWSGSGYWLTKPDHVETWDRGQPVTVTLSDAGQEDATYDSLFFPSHLDALDKYPVFLDGNHALVTIRNEGATGGSLLVVRDSYAHCLATFLAGDYQTIYLVDFRYYRDTLSQFVAEHPVDRVLYLYGVDNLVSDTNSAWLK